uniref:Uncharacterized protein n=1 Tax=Oryza glumipatula TaxID=40148 RepID=A0A0E0AIU6_9ORYZ
MVGKGWCGRQQQVVSMGDDSGRPNLDKEGLLEQLLQSAALLVSWSLGRHLSGSMHNLLCCGLGASEVTARVEGVGGAGQQCPSCAVDKCKEELSRLSMLGMRRSRGGLNLMDKILAVWEAFGIWQVIYTSMNHKKQGFSYMIALAQVSEVMV